MLAGWQMVRGGVDVAITQAKRERKRREIKGKCHGMIKMYKINTDMYISEDIRWGVPYSRKIWQGIKFGGLVLQSPN